MHVLSSRSRFAGVGLERRATTPYAPIEGGGMSAARKYTRAGTRRGAGAAVGAGRAAVGAGGTAVDRGAAVVADLGAGGTAVGRATFGAGGTGVGRSKRKVGRTLVRRGAFGRGAAVVAGFGAPIGAFRCAKHLFLRASQAGSAPRLMHSPRA